VARAGRPGLHGDGRAVRDPNIMGDGSMSSCTSATCGRATSTP
jgi:hypothetical protein